MKFTVSIDCNNSAFDDGNTELARILRDLATRLDNGVTQAILKDINGNIVGQAEFFLSEVEQIERFSGLNLNEPYYVE